MPLIFRRDLSVKLTVQQGDGNWDSICGAPVAVNIVSGVITVNGQGRYVIDTEGSAATDEVIQIIGLPAHQLAEFQSVSSSRKITFVHGTNLKTELAESFTLETPHCFFIVRSEDGTVVKEHTRKTIPD
jgi:hypothetical protein